MKIKMRQFEMRPLNTKFVVADKKANPYGLAFSFGQKKLLRLHYK